MKKFLEKHDLFKLVGFMALIIVVLSWVCEYSYFNNGTLATDGFNRAGVFDVITYGILAVRDFFLIFAFIFAVAGFYKFLNSTEAYKKLTDKIANKFTGKEKVFVAISIFVFAIITSVINEYYLILAVIPFVITILSKLKVDKITGFISTFGGALLGLLGSTYSLNVAGALVDSQNGLGVSYGYELVAVIILSVIAYLILTYFVFKRINKKNENYELLVDPFVECETDDKDTKKKNKKVSIVPLVIVLILTLIVLLLGFINWEKAFNVTVFTDAFNWLKEATLFDNTIYYNILGENMYAFGNWNLMLATGIILISTLIIKIIYNVPFSKVLDEYTEGTKKVNGTVFIVLLIYTVLELTYAYLTLPVIIDKIMSIGSNIGTLYVSGFLSSIFTVDLQYALRIPVSVFSAFEKVNVAALTFQSAYGLSAFIAPTSLVLMSGLSMLNIKYKEYFKFIWKFLLALIVVSIAIIAIIMYV